MLRWIHIREGIRIYWAASQRKRRGFFQYPGKATEICQAIIKACWNGSYFMTSAGHFSQFWTRDFGLCAEALVELGYGKRVRATLEYALSIFEKKGHITTTITPHGTPFDFPKYAVDSVPYLIHSIKVSKATDLLPKHATLIKREIDRCFKRTFNPRTSMVRHGHFSSFKDYAIRDSSTYDNCMLAMLRNDLTDLGLENPFARYDITSAIKHRLWNGRYFFDDIHRSDVVTGDANIYPFWIGVFDDPGMFQTVEQHIKKQKLEQPFPLKYSNGRDQPRKVWEEIFVRGYITDSIWSIHGMNYIMMLKKFGYQKKFERLMSFYRHIIEKHRNFLEVFNNKGEPFATPFYLTDESMLWAAHYLILSRHYET